MKKSLLQLCAASCCGLSLFGCVSIPKESVELSRAVSKDIEAYKSSHIGFVEMYFDKMEDDINDFVDQKISPAFINAMVNSDLRMAHENPQSLFATLARVQSDPSQTNTLEAVATIAEFQAAINQELESVRNELLAPVRQKRNEVVKYLTQSYDVTIDANSSVSAYLASAVKVKEKQDALFSYTGIAGLNDSIADRLASLSSEINRISEKTDGFSPNRLVDSISSMIKKELKTVDNGK